jgi:hypothetical protein
MDLVAIPGKKKIRRFECVKLYPEFCTQKLSAKFGVKLAQLTGRGDGCSKIQVSIFLKYF